MTFPARYPLTLLAVAAALMAATVTPAVKKIQKIEQDLDQAQSAKGKKPVVAFQLTEAELNDYLRWTLAEEPRPVVTAIKLDLRDGDQVTGRATLDLDDIERTRPGTVPKLLQFVIHGVKTFTIDMRFKAQQGLLTFEVQKADLDGIAVPSALVTKIIQIAAERQPEHYDTRKPIPLPNGVRTVTTGEDVLRGSN